MFDGEQARIERQRFVDHYGEAYERLSGILFEEDPVGINYEENGDEYEPEVETILPRLGACRSADEVTAVVHEEFVKWFDRVTAGPDDRYRVIAERVWREIVPLLPGKTRGVASEDEGRS